MSETDTHNPDLQTFLDLYGAVRKGDTAVVESLLHASKDPLAWYWQKRFVAIYTLGPRDFAPVNLAVMCGHVDVFHLLLSFGFDPHEKMKNTPLRPIHQACRQGCEEMVRTLVLTYGVDVDSPDGDGITPLYWAVLGGSGQLVRYLIKAGACVNHRNGTDRTALHLAASRGRYKVGRSGIRRDVSAGNPWADIVRVLLDAGADINVSCGTLKSTSFMEAVQDSNLEIVHLLSRRGADVDAVTSKGFTALHLALSCQATSYCVLRYLLVDLNMSPLAQRMELDVIRWMCQGDEDMVELLYGTGCCVYPDSFQHTLRVFDLDERGLFPRQYISRKQVHVTSARLEYLRRLSSCPRTLSQLACLTVRRTMAREVTTAVDCLPLPQKLKDFVKLNHIVKH